MQSFCLICWKGLSLAIEALLDDGVKKVKPADEAA